MATKPPPTPRKYSGFLMPLLHRQFINAVLWCAVSCYFVALWQSSWESSWALIPIVRTSLLWLATVASLVPHVSQMHVGRHEAASPFLQFLHIITSYQMVYTSIWYLGSAWLFSECYIWSRSQDDNLFAIDPGRPYEKVRLNERPVFIRSLFLTLGVTRSLLHLLEDKSRLKVPAKKTADTTANAARMHAGPGSLIKEAVDLTQYAATAVLCNTAIGTTLYLTLLRRHTWHLALWAAKLTHSLPKVNKMSRTPPYIGDLIGRSLVEGFILLLLWELASLLFKNSMAASPLKKGQPLSAQSNDPNGSLIQGLKVKKEVTRTFAFWELEVIASRFEHRRESIFKDIDRVGGSAWSQLVTVCLGELHAVSQRIQDFQSPPKPAPISSPQAAIKTLPKIAAPIHNDVNVLQNPPKPGSFEAQFGSFAKARGLSPGAVDPVTPNLVRLFHAGLNMVLSEQTQKAFSESSVAALIRGYWIKFLKTTWFGPWFRCTFARIVSAIIFGGPSGHSNVSSIADATHSLAQLAVCSIREDRYGRVNKDVANIIRTYTLAIQTIENFVRTQPVHWTDVSFDRQRVPDPTAMSSTVFGAGEIEAGRKVPDVEAVLDALKLSLGALLDAFGEYREELGLKLTEVRRAKEVIGRAA